MIFLLATLWAGSRWRFSADLSGRFFVFSYSVSPLCHLSCAIQFCPLTVDLAADPTPLQDWVRRHLFGPCLVCPWPFFLEWLFLKKQRPLSKPKTAGNEAFRRFFAILVSEESARSTRSGRPTIADKGKAVWSRQPGEIGSESKTAANKSRLPPNTRRSCFDFTAPFHGLGHKRSAVRRAILRKTGLCKYARLRSATYRRTFKKSVFASINKSGRRRKQPSVTKDARFLFRFKISTFFLKSFQTNR